MVDSRQLGFFTSSPYVFAPHKCDDPVLSLRNIKYIACGSTHSLVVTDESEVFGCGRSSEYQLGFLQDECSWTPLDIPNIKHVTHVACGSFFSIVVNGLYDLLVLYE